MDVSEKKYAAISCFLTEDGVLVFDSRKHLSVALCCIWQW